MTAVVAGAVLLLVVLVLRRAKSRARAAASNVLEDLGDGGVGWARDPINGQRDRGGF